MAQEKKIGKGQDPDFKQAVEKARQNSGHSGWFKITEVLVKVENPLREYHVTLEQSDPPS